MVIGDERREKKYISEITELKVTAQLSVIQVCLQTAYRPLATMDVDGFSASVAIKKSSTHFDAVLQSVSIGDLNPNTIYNKVWQHPLITVVFVCQWLFYGIHNLNRKFMF